MSMESVTTGHLDEGDVVRILDGEVTEEERATWTIHLRSCESCRRLHEEIHQQSTWFRSAVTHLDSGVAVNDLTRARALAAMRVARRAGTEEPSRQTGSGEELQRRRSARAGGAWYRLAAAAVAVVLFVGLAVEPVRAWIRENVLAIATPVEEPASEAPAVPTASDDVASASAVTARFSARGPVFRIDLDQHQQAGTLTVRLTSEGQGSAMIIGSTEEGLLWVPPSSLRIGNASESSASYVVELPAAEINEVVVRAGGEPLGTRTLSTVGEEIEIDLATGAPVP